MTDLPAVLQDIPLGLDKEFYDQYKSLDEKQDLYADIKKAAAASSWMIADFFTYLWQETNEKTLNQFAASVNESPGTVNNYIRTARAFPPSTRNPMVTFSHHFQAMQADAYDRKSQLFLGTERFKWLDMAVDQRWTTRKLNEEVMRTKRVKELGTAAPCYMCKKIDEYVIPFNFYNTKTKLTDHMDFHELCYEQLLAYAKKYTV